MSRRRFVQPDSLEMLLDTMCNTFGGIILIALLIALLSRETRAPGRESGGNPAETRAVERLTREVTRATELRRVLEARLAQGALADRLPLLREREQLRQQLDAVNEEALRLEAESQSSRTDIEERVRQIIRWLGASNQVARAELARLTAEQAQLTNSLAAAQSDLTRVTTEFRTELSQHQRRSRPPAERPTNKDAWALILKHGRIYPAFIPQGGERERNVQTLEWRRGPGGETRVEPIAGRGIDLQSNADALAGFFQGLPANNSFIMFHVYPDSFGVFLRAKEQVLQRGLEYGFQPLRADAFITTGAARDNRVL